MKRLIIVLSLGLAALQVFADLAVTTTSRHAFVVVQDTRFNIGVQLGADLGVGVHGTRTLGPRLRGGIGGGLGLGTLLPSQISGGLRYRGLASRFLWVDAWLTSGSGIGAALTARGVLSSYELTTLLFFYPEVSLGPTLRTRIGPRTEIEWGMPFSYQFRSDLAFSLSIGIEGRMAVDFGAPR